MLGTPALLALGAASATSEEGHPWQGVPDISCQLEFVSIPSPPPGEVWLCRTLLLSETWADSFAAVHPASGSHPGCSHLPRAVSQDHLLCSHLLPGSVPGASLALAPFISQLPCTSTAPLCPMMEAQRHKGPGPRSHRQSVGEPELKPTAPKRVHLSSAPPFKAPDPRGQPPTWLL